MAREVTNFCVNCETCFGCSNEYDVIHYVCDDCGLEDNIDGETPIYEDEGHFYCEACLLRKRMSEFINDMIEEHGKEWCDDNFQKAPEAVRDY